MNIEQRLESGEATTNKEVQRAVSGTPLANQLRWVDHGKVTHINGWNNISREDVIASPDSGPVQDPKEAAALQQRLRKITGNIVLQTLNKRRLTESQFYRITRLDESYWRKWLAFQLRNDRLVLKDGVYRPGPQWAISLVSMR